MALKDTKILFVEDDRKRISRFAATMLDQPEKFMIDSKSRIFTKCSSCNEWHLFHEVFVEDGAKPGKHY